MRGVSRQLQTTRRERVNVGLSLTVFLTHMLSHHVVSRCFCQFELRPCCLFWRSSDWTEIWVWNRWFGNDLFRLGLHQWWTISRTCCELFWALSWTEVLVHFIILGEDQLSVQCWVSLALDSAAWNWESEALPPAVFKESWKPSKSHWTSKLKVQFSVNAVLAKKSQLQSHYQISSQYWCLFMQITSSQFLLDQISSNCPSLNLFSNMVQVIPTFCFNCSTYWVMMVLGGRQNMVWICDWSSCQCGGSCLLWLYTLRISLCVKACEIWLILKDPGCSQLLMVVLLHLLTS